MITFKRIDRKHIVTVDDKQFIFDTVDKALQFIFEIKRGVS